MAAKKATKKTVTPAPAPPQRITKKELEPDNKSAPPATETKTAKASAKGAKAGARHYVVTLYPPKGRRHAVTKKAIAPVELSAPVPGTEQTDEGVALSQARWALLALTQAEDAGTKAVVSSRAAGKSKAAFRRDHVIELEAPGRIAGDRR